MVMVLSRVPHPLFTSPLGGEVAEPRSGEVGEGAQALQFPPHPAFSLTLGSRPLPAGER
jgi:hypothetical protein